MSRLQQLYQEMIIEHHKNPRNFKEIPSPTHCSHGKNPLCGDDFYLYIKINDQDIIDEIGFKGDGCAISKASASMMTLDLLGKTKEDAVKLKNLFLKCVTDDLTEQERKEIGKLKVFEGVKQYPVRVKCAALIWRTLEDALESQKGEITTE